MTCLCVCAWQSILGGTSAPHTPFPKSLKELYEDLSAILDTSPPPFLGAERGDGSVVTSSIGDASWGALSSFLGGGMLSSFPRDG